MYVINPLLLPNALFLSKIKLLSCGERIVTFIHYSYMPVYLNERIAIFAFSFLSNGLLL